MGNEPSVQSKPEVAKTTSAAKAEPNADGKSSGNEDKPANSTALGVTRKGNMALVILVFALLGFAVWIAWGFRIALLPLVLCTMLLVVDVLVFIAKPKMVRVGNDERPRVFSIDLRLIAFGALLGLAIIGVKWVGDALNVQVEGGAWENWHWASRLLCAVLFTGLVALGMERLTKGD